MASEEGARVSDLHAPAGGGSSARELIATRQALADLEGNLDSLLGRLAAAGERERALREGLAGALGDLGERDDLVAEVSRANQSLDRERRRLLEALAAREADVTRLQARVAAADGERRELEDRLRMSEALLARMLGTRLWRTGVRFWRLRRRLTWRSGR